MEPEDESKVLCKISAQRIIVQTPRQQYIQRSKSQSIKISLKQALNYVPSHIPIASKAGKHRTASAQRITTKGKSYHW